MTPTPPVLIERDGNIVRMTVVASVLELSPAEAKNLASALNAYAEIARLSQEMDEG